MQFAHPNNPISKQTKLRYIQKQPLSRYIISYAVLCVAEIYGGPCCSSEAILDKDLVFTQVWFDFPNIE